MAKFKSPEALLDELGVSEPADIKIEAIAQYCGATILYERLVGCEAHILGRGNRAIITVNSGSPRPRQRFSAAHELGHWMRDRGRIAYACAEAQFLAGWEEDDPERRANRYAADLLLPKALFRPAAKGKPITFGTVSTLANIFETSLTATAIRLVEEGALPSMLVCCDDTGRRWFARSQILPDTLWPHEKPGRGTLAHTLLRGNRISVTPSDVDANEWIDHPRAREYVVREDSVRVSHAVLTLLWWKDERMVIDLDRDSDEGDDAADEAPWRR